MNIGKFTMLQLASTRLITVTYAIAEIPTKANTLENLRSTTWSPMKLFPLRQIPTVIIFITADMNGMDALRPKPLS